VGLSVEIGETLLLVTNPCPRCVMTTLPQADLPQDHGILRTAAQHNKPYVPALGIGDAECGCICERAPYRNSSPRRSHTNAKSSSRCLNLQPRRRCRFLLLLLGGLGLCVRRIKQESGDLLVSLLTHVHRPMNTLSRLLPFDLSGRDLDAGERDRDATA
jgi:hypothetical protein